MPVAIYRVVDAHGATVAEYVKGPVGVTSSLVRAVEHAARVGGRVFFIDRDGFLTLVWGRRTESPAAA